MLMKKSVPRFSPIGRLSIPVVVVKAFGESSVDLDLRVWIKNAREYTPYPA